MLKCGLYYSTILHDHIMQTHIHPFLPLPPIKASELGSQRLLYPIKCWGAVSTKIRVYVRRV